MRIRNNPNTMRIRNNISIRTCTTFDNENNTRRFTLIARPEPDYISTNARQKRENERNRRINYDRKKRI